MGSFNILNIIEKNMGDFSLEQLLSAVLEKHPHPGIVLTDDSLEPFIPKDSHLCFKQRDNYNDGDYVLVMLEDKPLIRKYYSQDDSIILVANNPKYPPIVYKKDKLKIKGKVVSYTFDTFE